MHVNVRIVIILFKDVLQCIIKSIDQGFEVIF